ncbi:hypothetical protein, partial [Mesomycoplasma ovipneumoniae]|uniref:hypothetical protein n=1 Tax=Mesomycoplasma ovipneumoniae TaxID=29562 RepID=UPI00117F21D2
MLGDNEGALEAYARASVSDNPLAVGRTTGPDDFWRGIAHLKLGNGAEAADVWTDLEAQADKLELTGPQVDYFATSLPELL